MSGPEWTTRFEIRLGLGLGPIRFGATLEEVESEVGAGGEQRSFEDGDKHLYFDALGLAFFFSHDDGNQLSSIEVNSHSECRLQGRRLFGEPIVVVLDAVRSSMGDAASTAVPTMERDDEETELRLPELSLNLYFDDKRRLRAIQWGPFPTGR